MSKFMNEFMEELEKMMITVHFDDNSFKLLAARTSHIDYEYDDKGRIVKSYSDLYGSSNVSKFEYDDKDNIIKITTINSGDETKTSVTEKEYDEQGRLVSSVSPYVIEEIEYTDDEMTKFIKNIEDETEKTEIYTKLEDNNMFLRYRKVYSVSEDKVVHEMTNILKDGIRIVTFEEPNSLGILSPVHIEHFDDATGRAIKYFDYITEDGNDIERVVEFEYNEDGDVSVTRLYDNGELRDETVSEIIKNADGSRTTKNHGINTTKYTKNGFNVSDSVYEIDYSDNGIQRQMAIVSEDKSIHLELIETKNPNSSNPNHIFKTVTVKNPDYNIDLVDEKLIDISVFVDEKKYEFGCDLYGSPITYVSVSTYNEEGSIINTTKVEYNRKSLDDDISKYISNKVYKFIEENKSFKDILELAGVNYENLKRE